MINNSFSHLPTLLHYAVLKLVHLNIIQKVRLLRPIYQAEVICKIKYFQRVFDGFCSESYMCNVITK